ncbi:MAG TPA: S-methyl-5'-thioadenosine phosphorylase [Phycisphaerae bacterium]|nr:S-methyl-5'-thioadenosine phosphorylase [Phycisphaerae bacterium]
MSEPRIGIIGGSGLGETLAKEVGGREVNVETPFGSPSGPILMTRWEGVDIAFLARHGPGHLLNPSVVPYRANIHALKKLGVSHILASGATGSLREEIAPRDLVICDQVIDRTFKRANTFFDDGLAVHVEFGEPFCPKLRSLLIEAAKDIHVRVHPAGTYVCMEGPQFSTVAESQMHRAWGGDLIGMTCMPEAKLAREAEICYALIGLPTDYDCWRPHEPGKNKVALLNEIVGNLKAVTENGIKLLRAAVPMLAKRLDESWPCADALALAIWSDKTKADPRMVKRLELLVGRYFK